MKMITKNRYILISLLVTIFIIMPSTISAIKNDVMKNTSNITPTIYQTEVDQDYGFYRVIDITTSKPAPYDKNSSTLTIYVGDIVIWDNDATPDEPLTIISKEGLWGNRSAYLRWNYQKFTYTFNQSGIYEMYIKEYPREQHQTIIVNNIPGTIDVISTPTVTLTTNPTINETVNTTNAGIADKTSSASPGKTNLVPIEVIVVIAILVILAMYIKKK